VSLLEFSGEEGSTVDKISSKETTELLRIVGLLLILAGIFMLGYGGYIHANAVLKSILNTTTTADGEVPLAIVGGIMSLVAGAFMLFLLRDTHPTLVELKSSVRRNAATDRPNTHTKSASTRVAAER